MTGVEFKTPSGLSIKVIRTAPAIQLSSFAALSSNPSDNAIATSRNNEQTINTSNTATHIVPSTLLSRQPFKRPVTDGSSDLATLKLRYPTAKTLTTSTASIIAIDLVPSDPDFPFDLPFLRIEICIPKAYPTERSTITVKDTSIPLQLKRSIEDAWRDKPSCSLLDMCKWLDRSLESLLVSTTNTHSDTTTMNTTGNAFIDNEKTLDTYNKVKTVENTTHSPPIQQEQNSHRGIQIRFPNMQLQNIACLACKQLSLTLKCEHCKHPFDKLLTTDTPHWASCPQCSTSYGARYRTTFLTRDEPSIGYIDLDGVSVLELLPSMYVAICECGLSQVPSTNQSSCFKDLVRGWRTERSCQGCHFKMAFMVDTVKFVKLGPSILQRTPHLITKKKKQVGPLVGDGTCAHYKKSHRWLRFGCCGKVYACDICHEEGKGDAHEMVWATKMICGFCHKEQAYVKNKECECGHALTKKSGAFWNGGTGNRDRVKMSKNDDQKYKGLSKTVSNKARK